MPVTETAELSGITPAAPNFNVPEVIVVEPNAAFKFTHQQIENIFTLTVEKDDTQRAYLEGGIEYQGRPMSLNFQDIPIRSVLQIIAGYN